MCARRQREILRSGAALLRPGGRLVYSTCTFAPQENEETVAAFLADHPEFVAEYVDAPWFTPSEFSSWRIWPHKVLPSNSTVWEGYPSADNPYNGPWWWWSCFKYIAVELQPAQ